MFKKSYFMLCRDRRSNCGEGDMSFFIRACRCTEDEAWEGMRLAASKHFACETRDVLVLAFNRV